MNTSDIVNGSTLVLYGKSVGMEIELLLTSRKRQIFGSFDHSHPDSTNLLRPDPGPRVCSRETLDKIWERGLVVVVGLDTQNPRWNKKDLYFRYRRWRVGGLEFPVVVEGKVECTRVLSFTLKSPDFSFYMNRLETRDPVREGCRGRSQMRLVWIKVSTGVNSFLTVSNSEYLELYFCYRRLLRPLKTKRWWESGLSSEETRKRMGLVLFFRKKRR